MKADRKLFASFLQALLILVCAFLLHDVGPLFDASPEENTGLNSFAWALALVAVLRLLGGLASWLGREPQLARISTWLETRERSVAHVRRYLVPTLQALSSLWPNALWIVLVFGALLATPQIISTLSLSLGEWDTETIKVNLAAFRGLAPWALGVLGPFALARASVSLFPSIGRVFPLPRGRLLVLGLAYVLLADGGILSAAIKFQSSQLLVSVALAVGLSYAISGLRRSAWRKNTVVKSDEVEGASSADYTELAAILTTSCSIAVLFWGIAGSLPSLTTAFLVNSVTAQFGEASLPHLSRIFDSRYLLSGIVLVLSAAILFPAGIGSRSLRNYRPLVKLIGLGISGFMLWTLGVQMAPLGHLYPLLGATAAVGMFSVALSHLASYVVNSRYGAVAGIARWLSESTTRAFLIGSSLTLYGLLVRPLLYDILWFAQLFEWLAVLAIAVICSINIMPALRRSNVVTTPAPEPETWTGWRKHTQTVQALPDERFESILGIQRGFIDSCELRHVWGYLLGLMLRNSVALEEANRVFRPLRTYFVSSSNRRLRLEKLTGAKQKRALVLSETQRRVESALSQPSSTVGIVDESSLRAIGASFADGDGEPDVLAVALVAAYWQQGTKLGQAIELWFPLMTLLDERPRWYHLPRTRAELVKRNRQRRQAMVKGAIAHLFEDSGQEYLPVAIPSREAIVYTRAFWKISVKEAGYLVPGIAVEVLDEREDSYRVRISARTTGYMSTRELVRQPLLPKDHDSEGGKHG